MNHAHLKGLARGEVGQQAGQPGGEHGFAPARGADEQQVVAARGRDLQGAARGFHPFHLGEVEAGRAAAQRPGGRRGEELGAPEMIDEAKQIGRGENVQLPGPARLRALGGGADQPPAALLRGDGGGQHPGGGVQPAVEGKLPQRRVFRQFLGRHHLHRRQHGERHRQVEMAAFLQHVRRGEVDEDAFGRQAETHRGQGGADPLPRFPHRLVRQADHEKGGQAGRDLHLDLDALRLDPRKREGIDPSYGHSLTHHQWLWQG